MTERRYYEYPTSKRKGYAYKDIGVTPNPLHVNPRREKRPDKAPFRHFTNLTRRQFRV
jgi:hypothetical protein